MLLRFEKKEDIKGIHSVHVESFETDQEAKLVDDLRLGDLDLISLVAEKNQKIIGHLLFSPVFLDSNIKIKMMGLAPLAILPTYQNRGIGTLLVRKGLDVCVQKNESTSSPYVSLLIDSTKGSILSPPEYTVRAIWLSS